MRSINRPISARMPRRRMGVGGWQLFCRRLLDFTVGVTLIAAVTACAQGYPTPTADTILHNGRVYTFTWDDPALDGTPAANAPFSDAGWQPDATAIAIEGGTILFVGSDEDAESYRGQTTRVVDLEGATVLPGLVDAHSHVANLGTVLEQVSLVGINSEEEAVERVAERAASVPAGEWIVGYGWDEGAWADHYPDMKLLSERVPDHPVILRGLHSFAAWGNRLAFERAGITAASIAPAGGEIVKDAAGRPTGLLMNTATRLLEAAMPEASPEKLESRIVTGLEAMAKGGYTMVHEAGVDSETMAALENLASENKLPVSVYAMLSARDEPLLRNWLEWGPDTDGNDKLITRAVKAFADGALGSRGARLLEDYSDRPGHRGVSGAEYGFNRELVGKMMAAGFQVAIHAIGDAGNRETLDFIASVLRQHPEARASRHRIEHAQVVHPDDIGRFRQLGLIASMQPPHAVEDMAWAEQRLGPERIKGAYAWRTLRQAGARLVFSSDLPGSSHDIFYGLHSAITRQDRQGLPEGGWYPHQRMTPEEALRGYTTWAAASAFLEDSAGTLAPGMWADITVADIDPLNVGSTDPLSLLDGKVRMTLVRGAIVYDNDQRQ